CPDALRSISPAPSSQLPAHCSLLTAHCSLLTVPRSPPPGLHAPYPPTDLPDRRLCADLSRVFRPHLPSPSDQSRREHLRGVGRGQLPPSPARQVPARLPGLG